MLVVSMSAAGPLAAAASNRDSRPVMLMIYTPVNKIVELSADGKLVWEHQVPSLAVMFERLPNGNVMYAYGGNPSGVQEVDRQHKVVWNYVAKCEQVLGFMRLKNGNVLLGEQGPCQAVEVNRKGEVVRVTPLFTNEKPAHRQLRGIRKLDNGNLLACHEADATVREYDVSGKVVWEYPGVENVFSAIRLKNGNTLIGAGTTASILEVTRAKEVVWRFGPDDAPELGMNWITGIEVLKNGNLVVANFLRGKEGKGVHAFEVTRKKKVLWTFADHSLATLATMGHYLNTR